MKKKSQKQSRNNPREEQSNSTPSILGTLGEVESLQKAMEELSIAGKQPPEQGMSPFAAGSILSQLDRSYEEEDAFPPEPLWGSPEEVDAGPKEPSFPEDVSVPELSLQEEANNMEDQQWKALQEQYTLEALQRKAEQEAAVSAGAEAGDAEETDGLQEEAPTDPVESTESTEKKTRSKRQRVFLALAKICLALFVVGIVVGAFVLIVQSYVKNCANTAGIASYEQMDTLLAEKSAAEPYDAVIILGARVHSDTVVSDMLRDRLLAGYEVYRRGYAKKIIVSGDHGREDYDEVVAMKSFLLEKGVSREDIFMDHAGFNTYDSLYRARDIFQVERAVVVTQEYHLYRAVYIGTVLGMDVVGVGADLDVYNHMTYNELREMLARVKAVWDAEVVRRKPQYLGEPIPVGVSDGRDTEDDKAAAMFDRMEEEKIE